ncbi:MAG: hypothetical protein ACK5AZ_27345, partial [Bryobacteraceae bacterium]
CADTADGSTVSPCPTGQGPQVLTAYVFDPSQAARFDAVTQPFDYATASLFWTAAFVFTLTLYITPRIIGEIIRMVRHGM